jgi:hypothetical protein
MVLGAVACGTGRSRRDDPVQEPSPIYPLEGPGFARRGCCRCCCRCCSCSCRMVGCRSSARTSRSGDISRKDVKALAGGNHNASESSPHEMNGSWSHARSAADRTERSTRVAVAGHSPPPASALPFRQRPVPPSLIRPRWEAVEPRRRATLDTVRTSSTKDERSIDDHFELHLRAVGSSFLCLPPTPARGRKKWLRSDIPLVRFAFVDREPPHKHRGGTFRAAALSIPLPRRRSRCLVFACSFGLKSPHRPSVLTNARDDACSVARDPSPRIREGGDVFCFARTRAKKCG